MKQKLTNFRLFKNTLNRNGITTLALTMTAVLLPALGQAEPEPFEKATVIIELTEDDIELQVFVDDEYKHVRVLDPRWRTVFTTNAKGKMKRQGGFSEIYYASEPTHFLLEDEEYDGPITDFLERFKEGTYTFIGKRKGQRLRSTATLTHDLPALPEITSPVSESEDPPEVDPSNVTISWEPVISQFMSAGPVTIVEYQVIVELAEIERETPEWTDGTWVDGKTRRILVNLPADATSLKVPEEFLLPNTLFDYEVLAIEKSGNATISSGEFLTTD